MIPEADTALSALFIEPFVCDVIGYVFRVAGQETGLQSIDLGRKDHGLGVDLVLFLLAGQLSERERLDGPILLKQPDRLARVLCRQRDEVLEDAVAAVAKYLMGLERIVLEQVLRFVLFPERVGDEPHLLAPCDLGLRGVLFREAVKVWLDGRTAR